MSAHLFISYSRTDQRYARQLAAELRGRGFAVWIDEQNAVGDRWWQEIVRAIETCAGLILLMSPASAASEWVEKELLLAQSAGKPIFPLLLQGAPHAFVVNLQVLDVSDGQLPGRLFYHRLKAVAPAMPRLIMAAESQPALPLAAPYLRLRQQPRSQVDRRWAPVLVWTPVLAAEQYLIEQGVDRSFSGPVTVYRSERSVHYPALAGEFLPTSCYRVQATAPQRPASPWSNVITLDLTVRTPLPAPELTLDQSDGSSPLILAWGAVPGAVGYLLERSAEPSFVQPSTIFEGDEQRFVDLAPGSRPGGWCYRVKALAWDGSASPWSKLVVVDGRPGLMSINLYNRSSGCG